MRKMLFTANAELKRGDGSGPKFTAGKAYLLSDDQAARWVRRGVAADAPAEMRAENEPRRAGKPALAAAASPAGDGKAPPADPGPKIDKDKPGPA